MYFLRLLQIISIYGIMGSSQIEFFKWQIPSNSSSDRFIEDYLGNLEW
jgi:hypothetical protein